MTTPIGTLVASTLINFSAPATERSKALSPYFEPPPGTTITADRHQLSNFGRRGDPMSLRGFIKVVPPKGHCLTITKHPDLPDIRVCQPQTVAFELREVDDAGRVVWSVKSATEDPGTELTWPTPHRIAQYIPAGDLERNSPVFVPLMSCKASIVRGERVIRLTLVTGEEWVVRLPPKDVLVPQPKPVPKLFIQRQPKKLIAGQKDVQQDDDDEEELSEEEAAKLAESKKKEQAQAESMKEETKQSGFLKFKRLEKDTESIYNWNIQNRYAFGMKADQVRIGDAPKGLNGECRYRLSGAPLERDSGLIECHSLDKYDAIFAAIPCIKDLAQAKP